MFAYAPVDTSGRDDEKMTELVSSISKLEKLVDTLPSTLAWHMLRCDCAIELGWKFDHSVKTGESPFELLKTVENWKEKISMLLEMDEGEIFLRTNSKVSGLNKWERANRGFNYFWPKNTADEEFTSSLVIATERLKQMTSQYPDFAQACKGARVLDVGCGPGRYMYELKLSYGISSAHGIDSGEDIIHANRERFSGISDFSFEHGSCNNLLHLEEGSFDIALSNGVIHHSGYPLAECIPQHARALRTGGYFFFFVYGDGGLELRVWEAMQSILNKVEIEFFYDYGSTFITHKRLQGLMDHAYGSFYYSTREEVEGLLKASFSEINRVNGVLGMDITPEVYPHDKYFSQRYGSGMHRYLCKK